MKYPLTRGRDPAPRRPTTIFLAEDDEDMRNLIGEGLRSDGYEVVEAKDGAELLELLSDAFDHPLRRPDVVVTDVLMPGFSGLGVLSTLRRSRWNVPVVLITAQRDSSVRTLAARLGAAAVFWKPFDLDDLRTAILNASVARAGGGTG